jgi:3-deoxy-D-manno-octulosonic-acid transferase
MSWAHRLYRFVMRVLLPVWLAALWWRGRKQAAYRQGLRERLGFIEVVPNSLGGVLLHATSVGEMQAALPLIKALMARLPPGALTISCQTPTGIDTFKTFHIEGLRQVYWPIDTYSCVRRFLNRLQPRLVVLMEREIWPEMMQQCHERAIDVAVINARLSPKSLRSYQKFKALMHPIWQKLALVAAADEASAERHRALGAPSHRVCVTGNIKFDAPQTGIYEPPAGLPPLPNLSAHQVLVAGSTHEAEEQALLDAWPAFYALHPQSLLVLVPRHPQRFEDVAKALAQRQLPFVRRSLGQVPQPDTQIVLGDTMGELPAWYLQAKVCFIGGSLVPIGGHNALEALCLGKPVLFGPHTHNFEALYLDVLHSRAGHLVQSGAEIFTRATQWLDDPLTWQAMSAAATALYVRNQGSCARSLDALQRLLPSLASHGQVIAAQQVGRHQVWWDTNQFETVTPEQFEASYWVHENLSTGSGRGQVHRLAHNGRRYLLRHYRRGGLMAKISQDRFAWQRPELSRAMQEMILLRAMSSLGLPVPTAVAAHHERGLLTYRANIIVGWVEGSRNLVEILKERALSYAEWGKVGHVIAQMHHARVYHSDLNAHNLLLDLSGKVWVVDFDKCGFRAGKAWQAGNLQRLLRSLRKETKLHAGFCWDESQWPQLVSGYDSFSAS